MEPSEFIIRQLTPAEANARIPDLSTILIDCVHAGASVSFMAPLPPEKAHAFWRGVAESVAAGDRILFAAEAPGTSQLIGTVQLILRQPENQPHRADVSKMLVDPTVRKRGIGTALMHALEKHAREAGKTLLVLDTATGGDAERLYQRLGWAKTGIIPHYALWPDGRPCDTTIYYKQLAP